jgi:hypothetical protein
MIAHPSSTDRRRWPRERLWVDERNLAEHLRSVACVAAPVRFIDRRWASALRSNVALPPFQIGLATLRSPSRPVCRAIQAISPENCGV